MKAYSTSIQAYIFTIGMMQEEQDTIHQIDIAIKLGYTRASVCKAMHSLQDRSLIQLQKQTIVLSDTGLSLYHQLKQRYDHLLGCMNLLMMPDILAQEYAYQLLFVVDETLMSYLPIPMNTTQPI